MQNAVENYLALRRATGFAMLNAETCRLTGGCHRQAALVGINAEAD